MVADEQLQEARLGLLQQRGFDGIRRRSMRSEGCVAKPEARFLERNTNGIVAPFSLTQAHSVLME